ncbi:MAG: PqqD family protein [Bacteroidetes bacterium]|nr:PqqD family protein [Bacteroidota bacterium]MBL0080240.1 PqqD family protein [Bacteroidota bacterium]MBL0286055.1 PqqD family protein [Bacteroidota bacterium]
MQINKNIAISDSGFIFNPSSGDSFSANQIGLEIIRLLKDGKSKIEISDLIINQYAVDALSFEKDFNDFVQMLFSYQLIPSNEQ